MWKRYGVAEGIWGCLWGYRSEKLNSNYPSESLLNGNWSFLQMPAFLQEKKKKSFMKIRQSKINIFIKKEKNLISHKIIFGWTTKKRETFSRYGRNSNQLDWLQTSVLTLKALDWKQPWRKKKCVSCCHLKQSHETFPLASLSLLTHVSI